MGGWGWGWGGGGGRGGGGDGAAAAAVAEAAETLGPWAAQGLAGAAGGAVGLLGAQALARLARVSCATPVAAPALGVLALAGSGALAGQCARDVAEWGRTGQPPSLQSVAAGLVDPLNRDRVALDAALGVALYAVMGGRFRTVMPSDLRYPGANASASLPAAGEGYIGEAQRQELQYFFQRFGCHHCGSRFGKVVGDHMPPNKYAHADPPRLLRSLRRLKPIRPVLRALNLQGVRQRFYPQCGGCSQRQAAAVRANRKVLAFHVAAVPAGALASCLVGLRHFDASVSPAAWCRRVSHSLGWRSGSGSGSF